MGGPAGVAMRDERWQEGVSLMPMSPALDAVFGSTIPEIRSRPDLGVPDPEELLAHFLAEHGGDCGYQPGEDDLIDGVVAFGGFDCLTPWPTDAELATARGLIGRRAS